MTYDHKEYSARYWRENKERIMEQRRPAQEAKNRRRRDVLWLVKTTAGCADCGYDTNPVAMEFDHVRGEKKAPVGNMQYCSWPRIWEEIMKCDVVCSNCHRIRTYERASK